MVLLHLQFSGCDLLSLKIFTWYQSRLVFCKYPNSPEAFSDSFLWGCLASHEICGHSSELCLISHGCHSSARTLLGLPCVGLSPWLVVLPPHCVWVCAASGLSFSRGLYFSKRHPFLLLIGFPTSSFHVASSTKHTLPTRASNSIARALPPCDRFLGWHLSFASTSAQPCKCL